LCQIVNAKFLFSLGNAINNFEKSIFAEKFVLFFLEIFARRMSSLSEIEQYTRSVTAAQTAPECSSGDGISNSSITRRIATRIRGI